MPTLDRLARNGLKYNCFHTTALCSPTRVALLTGHNHHSAGAGTVMEISNGFPGTTGRRPNNIAPLAEILRLNGYSTAAFGKSHETPAWERSISGPFDRWPTHSGFDKFYGFLGGDADQWSPTLYDGVTRIKPPKDPNYHLTTDITNQAIGWMRLQKAMTPQKPFFLYFAPGAVHAPHQAPNEWIAKYHGRFDGGWDRMRKETLARQFQLGVVPPGTKLTPKPEGVQDWDKLTADEHRLFARQMEVFAGFAAHTDHEIGRLVDALQEQGQLENTLLLYIVGDNGDGAEGGLQGTSNEMMALNGLLGEAETLADQLQRMDAAGRTDGIRPVCRGLGHRRRHTLPVDQGGRLALRRHSQSVGDSLARRESMLGGNPLAVPPCDRHRAHNPRSRWDCRSRSRSTGTAQKPMEGVSMVYTFDDAKAKSRHTDAILRDIRKPWRVSRWLDGGHQAPHAVEDRSRPSRFRSMTTSGSFIASRMTSARPTTWRRSIRRN